MKTLKKILLVIAILIAIPLIIALFVPNESASEGKVTIHKPAQEVYDYIKYVKNQDNYGVWQLSDPNMKTQSEGTDGTVGFKYSWDSEKLGKGAQVITGLKEGERIETNMYFYDFNDTPHPAFMSISSVNENTSEVSWGIKWTTPYPFNIMNLFNNMHKDFNTGLNNLKNILENKNGVNQ